MDCILLFSMSTLLVLCMTTSYVQKKFLKFKKSFILYRDFAKFKMRSFLSEYFVIGKITESVDDGSMILIYYKNDNHYRVASPIVKGLKNRLIKDIQSEGIEDSLIREFMGPHGNFHGIPTTPKMMGIKSKVLVTYKGNQCVEYGVDDVILTAPPRDQSEI